MKKSKVSTPISSDPGNVQLMPPTISPLVHKTTLNEEQFSHDNQTFGELVFELSPDSPVTERNENVMPIVAKCAILGCNETAQLRSLSRKKIKRTWRHCRLGEHIASFNFLQAG